MVWYLFLDDERDYLKYIPESDLDKEWKVARTFDEAVCLIKEFGLPIFISFDHDLGANSITGYDLAGWIVNQDQDEKLILSKNFSFFVHSANIVGRQNIECLLNNYLKFKKENSNE